MDNLNHLEKYFITHSKGEQTKVGLELITEAKFLKTTLDRLKKDIQEQEIINEMQQGSYMILRSNPALKTYNTTIGNYQKIMRQIANLLPAETGKVAGEELMKFITQGQP